MKLSKTLLPVCTLAAVFLPAPSFGHGFAGDRFFPATLIIDDPFVANEASLPTVSSIVTPDNGGTRVTDLGTDLSLKLTPNLGMSVGGDFLALSPKNGGSTNGFDNLQVGAMDQFFESDKHETILSLGLVTSVGGTGGSSVGANSFTTWTPEFLFGKGFGDLPDSVSLLKPIALTGVLGLSTPNSASTRPPGAAAVINPDLFNWGFALEYSLIDLETRVCDIGLPKPFNRMIPLVEFSFQTPVDRHQGGEMTGTVNPGVIWSGQYFQVGAEAMIPANSRSGSNVGFIAQLHFYLDDLFPSVFGHPLFGGN